MPRAAVGAHNGFPIAASADIKQPPAIFTALGKVGPMLPVRCSIQLHHVAPPYGSAGFAADRAFPAVFPTGAEVPAIRAAFGVPKADVHKMFFRHFHKAISHCV